MRTFTKKSKYPSDLKARWEYPIRLQETERQLLQLFTNQVGTRSIKYLYRLKILYLSDWILRFHNGCKNARGNWTSCRALFVWNRTFDFKPCCVLVWFSNHAYDFRRNCTPLCSFTIIIDRIVQGQIFLSMLVKFHSNLILINLAVIDGRVDCWNEWLPMGLYWKVLQCTDLKNASINSSCNNFYY